MSLEAAVDVEYGFSPPLPSLPAEAAGDGTAAQNESQTDSKEKEWRFTEALKDKEALQSALRSVIPPEWLQMVFKSLRGAEELRICWKEIQDLGRRRFLVLGMELGVQIWEFRNQGALDDLEEKEPPLICIGSALGKGVKRATVIQKADEKNDAKFSIAVLLILSEPNENTVHLYSFESRKVVQVFRFPGPVHGALSNAKYFVIFLEKELHIFSSNSLEFIVSVETLHNHPHSFVGALGTRFVAYQGEDVLPKENSKVHVYVDNQAKINSAGKYLNHVLDFTRTIVKQTDTESSIDSIGSIVIRDLKLNKTVAIMKPNQVTRMSCLTFDSSGILLAASTEHGQQIIVYRLFKVGGKSNTSISPSRVYTIDRGLLHTTIKSIRFSQDSRFILFESGNETCHITAIDPRGCKVDSNLLSAKDLPSSDFSENFSVSEDHVISPLARIHDNRFILSTFVDNTGKEERYILMSHASNESPILLSLFQLSQDSSMGVRTSKIQDSFRLKATKIFTWNLLPQVEEKIESTQKEILKSLEKSNDSLSHTSPQRNPQQFENQVISARENTHFELYLNNVETMLFTSKSFTSPLFKFRHFCSVQNPAVTNLKISLGEVDRELCLEDNLPGNVAGDFVLSAPESFGI